MACSRDDLPDPTLPAIPYNLPFLQDKLISSKTDY